jgi:endoglucanase
MSNLKLLSLCLLLTISYVPYVRSQEVSDAENIRLNQLGFYPNEPKIAIVLASGPVAFSLIAVPANKTAYKGTLTESVNPALNGKKTYIADFSGLTTNGKYILRINGVGTSYPFVIDPGVYHEIARGSVKAYYYIRASTALPEQYAGKWHRDAGHPDDKVLIHPSAASDKRPAGTVISTPGGWYDAGDYNKYVVNNGITVGTLLSLCEDFPGYIKTVNLNIPESKNNVPDMLDEILFDVRWMLTMQDPNDGGVYNKVTNASFDGMVMPWVTKEPRYVVQKGTAATLDFAAVTAQAARILKSYSKDFPGLADSCLNASVKAWDWAVKNPQMAYDQNAINNQFSPKVVTGAYGDHNFKDEFTWAASELYITTGNTDYYKTINILSDASMPLPSWAQVKLLGYYSLIRNSKNLKNVPAQDMDTLKKRVIIMADGLIKGVDDRAYRTVMGGTKREFNWGSNSNAGNQGIALIQAYIITGDKKYVNYAVSNFDYLMGRNGTGYSYVTGYGSKTPMHPHHRPSVADGIVDPVPGLLVGGPNPGMQDKVKLASIVPDEAYIDNDQAYAVNEIAINWNAPFAYLANAIEALRFKVDYAKK